MKTEISEINRLEKELNLKQLQIKSLLTITQAINNNVSADGLFHMYRSFLNWEMGIQKMMLFIKRDGSWKQATSINVNANLFKEDIGKILEKYQRLHRINQGDIHELQQFEIIIPVYHKDNPIAYAIIGEIGDPAEMYSKVQFITTITNIIAVAIENKRLFKRQIEQERLKKEIELASEVQKMLIPNRLPKGECFELASIYQPHYSIGGDYFDYIKLNDQRFVFCIADISGKGVAAALLMSNVQANLRSLVTRYKDLEKVVRYLNKATYRITKSEKYLTFFIAEIDLGAKTMHYVNAGHYPPFLFKGGEVTQLDKGCTILGVFKKIDPIEVGEIALEDEVLILSFTDGLIELKNQKGEVFDENRLCEILQRHHHLSAKTFNEYLFEELEDFRDEENYSDDISVLTCKLNL